MTATDSSTGQGGIYLRRPGTFIFDFIPQPLMPPKTNSTSSYLIVGAGCMGASTALHLKRLLPQAEVTLVDRTPFPNPSAAAHDLNKIVRSDYDDIFYMKLALEAMESWRTDPLFKQWYHETGMIWAGTEKMSNKVMENYRSLGRDFKAEILAPEVARKKFDGILRDTEWTGLKQCLWNPRAGWGDAEQALRSVIQAAVDIGVKYVVETVSTVLLHKDGSCIGAHTESGKILLADNTLLCSGAFTAKILADSAPKNKDLQVDGRMVAAAAIMCLYEVPLEERKKFGSAPVVINTMGHTQGESIPPGGQGLVKCTHEVSFTHNTIHKESGQEISVPPEKTSRRVWGQDIPYGLKEETDVVAQHMYGDYVKGLEPVQYRMCWDAVTPNQDWIICPHPKAINLFIAGGGSFHAWKFLPNVGAYIVRMLLGSLEAETANRWAWDREKGGDGACEMYIPCRDLKEIKGYKDMGEGTDKIVGVVNGH